MGTNPPDPGALEQAMTRYKHGDDAAFETVYELLAGRLSRYLACRVHSPQRVEDLLSDTFRKMIESRATYIDHAPVLNWALAIARSVSIDDWRRNQHERRAMVSGDGPEPASLDSRPDDDAAIHECLRSIERLLPELPTRQREAFEHVRLQGLTLAATAEVLGTTVMAVSMALHRAEAAIKARTGIDTSRRRSA